LLLASVGLWLLGHAQFSVSNGWQGAFTALAGVALLSGLVAALFLIEQRRSVKTKTVTEAM